MRHVAFSAGARNCVGQPLAIRMIPTIAAVLLRSFHFELQDPDHFKLRLKRVGTSVGPVAGIPIKITRRRWNKD
jgi:cytochrome P450